MRDNECQNSRDLVIDLGKAATTTLNLEPSFAQSKGAPPTGFPFYPIRSTTSFAQSRSI